MSELVKSEAAVSERTIEVVTLEIQTLNRQAGTIMLSYAVEIGRRLAAEKELSTKLEKAQKAAEAEAERLKKELKSSGNQDVALFDNRFQDVQKDFHAMVEALGRVGAGGDAGQHDKLVDALRTLMAALEQSIPEKLETRHG